MFWAISIFYPQSTYSKNIFFYIFTKQQDPRDIISYIENFPLATFSQGTNIIKSHYASFKKSQKGKSNLIKSIRDCGSNLQLLMKRNLLVMNDKKSLSLLVFHSFIIDPNFHPHKKVYRNHFLFRWPSKLTMKTICDRWEL